jgi:hypothetical protein
MTNVYYFLNGVDQAQYIGYLSHAQQARAFAQKAFEEVCPEMPFVIHGQNLKNGALALAHHLPGNDVGMMLAFGNDYLIAGTHERFPETESHEIDGRSSPGGEYDLLPALRIQELPDGIAGGFVLLRGLGRDAMYSTVEVGVAALGEADPFVDDRDRTLDGGRIVQIDKRLAIHRSGQGRKLLPELFYIHFQYI